jgi:outer membrane protein insertion porin family
LNFNYNSLDNIQNPRNGFVAEIKPEFAGVGGDSKFLRVAADARYYREIFDDVVGFAACCRAAMSRRPAAICA